MNIIEIIQKFKKSSFYNKNQKTQTNNNRISFQIIFTIRILWKI